MTNKDKDLDPYRLALDNIYENSTYSAQGYFEATKSAEFWGKVIVFVPAMVSAIAGILVALDYSKSWGAVSAAAGLVAATGSFLGSERKAPSFKESARSYTQLRHEVGTTRTLASEKPSSDLAAAIEKYEERYCKIVSRDEPIPNRLFKKANRRIKSNLV